MGNLVKGITSAFLPGAGQYFGAQEQAGAARDAAAAQIAAAQIAADAARFRPVGVTTRFGGSNFQFDDKGNLIGAGYTPSTQISGYQGALDQLTQQYLNQAANTLPVTGQLEQAGTRMFGLGAQALPTSYDTTQAAKDYMQQQQMLLAPGREREMAALQNQLYQTGRGGLSTGGTKAGYDLSGQGLMQSNPEMAALYNARAAQDAQLAAQAQQTARQNLIQDIGVGTQLTQGGLGMFSAIPQYQVQALSPFQTTFGTQQQLETAAQQPLDIGAQLGGRTASAGASQGQSLLYGGLAAGRTLGGISSPLGGLFTGLGQNAQIPSSVSSWFNNMINYGGTPQGGYAQQNQYLGNMRGLTQQELQLMSQMEGF